MQQNKFKAPLKREQYKGEKLSCYIIYYGNFFYGEGNLFYLS